jgi:hypothetical protein
MSMKMDSTFESVDANDELKKRYLLNAIPKFGNRCKQDLSDRDDANNYFNIKLTDMEKLILANLMLIEYLTPMIISLENIKQFVSSRDFQMTSQAAHLKQLQAIKEDKQREVNRLIVTYTYDNSLSDLK